MATATPSPSGWFPARPSAEGLPGCEGLSGGGNQPAEGATARKGGALGTSRNRRFL